MLTEPGLSPALSYPEDGSQCSQISPIVFLAQSGNKSLAEPSSAVQLDPETAKKLVSAQFGPGYTLLTPLDPMIGDFNGDGIPDLVLVAHATNPLVNSVGFNYKVIDPYYSFYGYGDPKVTMSFDASDPRNPSQ